MTASGSSSTSDHQPATDDAALERLRRFGGAKLLSDMISLFLEAAPGRLATARSGLEGGDASAVEMSLHSLKSSSAQLGALRMQRLCERGEREARNGQLDGLPAMLDELDGEMTHVTRWLEQAKRQDPS